MLINIYSNHSELPEFRYVTTVILEHWLGFEVCYFSCESSFIELEIQGVRKRLSLSDTFFSRFNSGPGINFLKGFISDKRYSLPERLAERLGIQSVPEIFNSGRCDISGNDMLPMDIFGVSFFMLTRLEEYHSDLTDEHGRFPGNQSLLYKLGCLDIPVIDIYLEILWHALLKISPGLQRKPLEYRKNITCDVDNPFLYHSTPVNLLRRTAGDFFRRRSLTLAYQTVNGLIGGRKNFKRDPYSGAVDFIIRENNKAGNKVLFNFIPYVTDCRYDGAGMFASAEVREMVNRITESQHRVGIHPGYNTADNQELLNKSVCEFKSLGLNNIGISGRQHYLRWRVGFTELLYEGAGITTDSTLGYADVGGFRCGTSRAFQIFSLKKRVMLALTEEPLLIMENTYFSNKYLGYGVTQEAARKMLDVKGWCKKLNGTFTVLWHNTGLITQSEREIYLEIIR